ncbi:hypothetical protein [Staphylospora marina]|uniref:hypothetical protein n=1 Tax=Staphylospora marina TaxID=2490858 RepID=UPI000F5BD7A9|nr:hypothetical protein [Staphylospora marina]
MNLPVRCNLDAYLRNFIGENVQIQTAEGLIEGVLLSVTSSTLTLRTASPPGYGTPATVVILLQNIGYIRILA